MLSSINDSGAVPARALGFAGFVVLALCAVLAAWAGARLFWSALALREPAPLPSGTVDGTATQATVPGPTVDLTSLHLFGQAGLPGQPVVVEAPETKLSLTLLGTAAADDPAAGLAIIADDSGQQGYYRAGDDLPGDAELEEIHPDRVILVRQGSRETLRLDRDEAAQAGASSSYRPRRGGPSGSTPRAPLAPAQPAAADWQAAANAARLDPKKLMQLGSQIRALPYAENGEPIGVRLVASRDATMIQRLGLRSSDIIMSVNGIPLTDATRQFELMRLLNTQSQFQVRLRRNGRDMTLDIDASSLKSENN